MSHIDLEKRTLDTFWYFQIPVYQWLKNNWKKIVNDLIFFLQISVLHCLDTFNFWSFSFKLWNPSQNQILQSIIYRKILLQILVLTFQFRYVMQSHLRRGGRLKNVIPCGGYPYNSLSLQIISYDMVSLRTLSSWAISILV